MKRYFLYLFIIIALCGCKRHRGGDDVNLTNLDNQNITHNSQTFNYIKINHSDVTLNIKGQGKYRVNASSILKYDDFVESSFSLNFPPINVLQLTLNTQELSTKSTLDKLNVHYPSNLLFVQTFQSVLLGQLPPLYLLVGKKDFNYKKAQTYSEGELLYTLADSSSVGKYSVDINRNQMISSMKIDYKGIKVDVSYDNYSNFKNLVIPCVININFVSREYNVNASIKRRDIQILDSLN